MCYRDNTLTNHQLTWTSICIIWTMLWRNINERAQVFVLQRQYFDEPSTYVDKYLCYRDNTLMNHQLTWTSIGVTETIRWWIINERGQVFVLQRQYFDEPSTYVDKYLCYRDNTLTNHQLTWTSICATETILWRTINLRGQVFVLQRQYVDESSTYVDKYLCYRDNTLTNHQLTWTSICVTETILWRTINLRGQVFVLQKQYVDESSTNVDKYLCYRDNTLTNHQLTWTGSCVTETIRWWIINLRRQVVVLQRQYFDEPSTYANKYLCYKDNTLMNHQRTWTSICVTETILWRTINLRGQVFVLQRQYVGESSTYVDK